MLDPSDSTAAANKSMGGSEGNISQCSLQSSKTKKLSTDLLINVEEGEAILGDMELAVTSSVNSSIDERVGGGKRINFRSK